MTGKPERLPPRVNVQQANAIICDENRRPKPKIIDVRSVDERQSGMIPGAKSVPLDTLLSVVTEEFPELDMPIILCCKTGMRGGLAQGALRKRGYTHLCNIIGGMDCWWKAGLPRKKPKRDEHRGGVWGIGEDV